MAGVEEAYREWIEATEELKSFVAEYFSGGFVAPGEPQTAPKRTFTKSRGKKRTG